jgi:hypothetical protein
MLDQQKHEPARFVHLATVGDPATARILAARLESEGIDVRLHGDGQSIYPMTIGALAETQLWVLSDRLAEASTLLLDAEVNDVLHMAAQDERSGSGMPLEYKLIALGVGAVLLVLWVLRLLAVY